MVELTRTQANSDLRYECRRAFGRTLGVVNVGRPWSAKDNTPGRLHHVQFSLDRRATLFGKSHVASAELLSREIDRINAAKHQLVKKMGSGRCYRMLKRSWFRTDDEASIA